MQTIHTLFILLYKHQWNTRWAFARKKWYFHTCYFHIWKDHCCYGYEKYCAFQNKNIFNWNGLAFHRCLYNKWDITRPLGDRKFLFSCWKYFTRWEVRCTHWWNIFQHSKRNLVFSRGHVISPIYHDIRYQVPFGNRLSFEIHLGV